MKLARFEDEHGRILTGVPQDQGPVARIVKKGDDGKPRETGELAAIRRYLPPVDPPNIFAVGRNYREHVEETGARLPESPLVFLIPTTAVTAHQAEIVLPAPAPDEVDYEAELAIVIGRRAHRVSPEQALDYVAGFTCANDVTARDCQRKDKQWSRAKGFDTFCPLGPWLVTPDEVDPQHLGIRCRLNGQLMQDANTCQMIHSCRELVSYLSHQFTLLPDTVILTGTPAGVGFARTPPVFLRPGDRVEVEIEGLGTLINTVRGPEPAVPA